LSLHRKLIAGLIIKQTSKHYYLQNPILHCFLLMYATKCYKWRQCNFLWRQICASVVGGLPEDAWIIQSMAYSVRIVFQQRVHRSGHLDETLREKLQAVSAKTILVSVFCSQLTYDNV